ncbi:hypothetical protein RchiOBHm_Chr3g0475611 [Rosa chinensis]|uniref:Uncharacterized protein n=1 Tax=Rosa chinensis TaxID=74649 RepID=A0A2P6RCG3_ROSCH|nr:hypothetical protein RchiOBHm_Chr3g0475611 [Rosa chinensis]
MVVGFVMLDVLSPRARRTQAGSRVSCGIHLKGLRRKQLTRRPVLAHAYLA